MKQQSCGEICTNPAFKYLQVAKHETNVLGYATLFNGGIYGSVGDLANDPKSLVMRLAKNR